jgi:hypothetical protein
MKISTGLSECTAPNPRYGDAPEVAKPLCKESIPLFSEMLFLHYYRY